MAWEAWLTLAVVALAMTGLARNWGSADLLMIGALAIVVLVGEITGSSLLPDAAAAVAGLGSAGLVTVAALFPVVAGLVQTQAMAVITEPLLGRPRNARSAQLRLMLPEIGLSAFLNNTPVVAMLLPVVEDLCKRSRISPSKLMIPLSYGSILGGICTLIGTSTNLIVAGLLTKHAGVELLGMFDIAWVGVPCALAGVAYVVLAGGRLLPDRQPPISLTGDPREYTVEMIVHRNGPLVDKTITEAGLRHLPGVYIAEIERYGVVLPAVGPEERLRAGDRLVFVGIVDSVVELQKIRGLTLATDQIFRLDAPRSERLLIEAVVSNRCPLVGKTIREGQFRGVYDAVVIAVARSGERIRARIGDIVLRVGDTLLLEGHSSFLDRQRNAPDFFLVSGIDNSAPLRRERSGVALAILVAMVLCAGSGALDIVTAALLAGAGMILTGCCTGAEARRSVEWDLLLVIAASIGLGKAMEMSGAAHAIAETLTGFAGGDAWTTLVAVYVVTMLLTEVVSNNAAAVIVFPIAVAAAQSVGASVIPFAVAIMIAASCGFATPIGYQTHMMVMGPGGYRFADFLRFGIPLDLICMVVAVTVTPLAFPF